MAEQKLELKRSNLVLRFNDGEYVQLFGLKTQTLNDKIGKVLSYDKELNRYLIEIDIDIENNIKKKAKLKSINMKKYCLYKITKIDNKGDGIIARYNIPKGSVILKDMCILSYTFDDEFNYQNMAKKWNKLNRYDKQKLLSLTCIDKNLKNKRYDELTEVEQIQKMLNIYEVNCVGFDNPGSIYKHGIYKTFSKVNHSCVPNCYSIINRKNGLERIIINWKDIKKDEEITINYLGAILPYDTRQYKLLDQWRFNCLCNECSKCINDTEYMNKMDKIYKMYTKYDNIIKTDTQESMNNKYKYCIKMEYLLKNDMIHQPRFILAKIYLYKAQLLLALKKYDDACSNILKSIDLDVQYYGKYMDWTDTNIVIKRIPSKKRKILSKYHNKISGLLIPKK